jgi:hypothetical protein
VKSSLDLVAFSKVYSAQARNKDVVVLPKYGPSKQSPSRSIQFVVDVGIEFLKTAKEKVRPHLILLTRSLLLTMNTILTKLREDNQALERCKECTDDIAINHTDQFVVLGFIEFIKFGLGPFERGADVGKSFHQFLESNENSLDKFASAYF